MHLARSSNCCAFKNKMDTLWRRMLVSWKLLTLTFKHIFLMFYEVCFAVLRSFLLVCCYCTIKGYKIIREKTTVVPSLAFFFFFLVWLLCNLIPNLRPQYISCWGDSKENRKQEKYSRKTGRQTDLCMIVFLRFYELSFTLRHPKTMHLLICRERFKVINLHHI